MAKNANTRAEMNFKALSDFMVSSKEGKAEFTYSNKDFEITYQVTKIPDKDNNFWVSFLNPQGRWRYVGRMYKKFLNHTPGSTYEREHTIFKTFVFLLCRLRDNMPLPKAGKIYYNGHCGRCGKRVSDKSSVLTGFGPVCIKKLNEEV